MQFTGVDKFFRGKISQYKKCIFGEKGYKGLALPTKHGFNSPPPQPPPPPELAFQFTYSSMVEDDFC